MMLRKIKRRVLELGATFLTPLIRIKFSCDRRSVGLEDVHWDLYKNIHLLTIYFNHRLPSLKTPKSFNDKIQWLKLFDQRQETISCSDKLGLKAYVEKRLGPGFTPETLFEGASAADMDFQKLPQRFVIKTNHDSGTVILVRDKYNFDFEAAKKAIADSLNRAYGWLNGEWAYSMIQPKVFVEEYLGEPGSAPPPDYKFHCADGKALWLQYIYDRGVGTKEVIATPEGEVMGIHFDHKMEMSRNFDPPRKLAEMRAIAERLSAGHKYARVDLYLVGDRIYVGEITFFPLMGCYKGKGQEVLGELISLDTSTRTLPIYMNSPLYGK